MDQDLATPKEVQSLVAELTAAAKNYSSAPGYEGHMARAEIISRAEKLKRALIGPFQAPTYHGLNIAELVAIRTFMKLGVLQAIPQEGSILLDELSKATGVQESLLGVTPDSFRLLGQCNANSMIQNGWGVYWAIVTGFLRQTRSDGCDFAHTKFSRGYITTTPSPGHLFQVMYDEWFKNMHNFDEYVVTHGLREPDDPLSNPYTSYHKQEGTPVWSIMEQNPEKMQAFQISMAGLDPEIPVTGHFNFSTLRNNASESETGVVELVDVGGGHGMVLKRILDAHPELSPKHCVLQDRPEVIELAKSSGVLPKETTMMAHDFMTTQPVKGAKAYFMRMVLHDYGDKVATEILSRLVESMSAESRVLICEMILPPRVDQGTFPYAVLDQIVMTMGGKERKEPDFVNILNAAGLGLVQVWRVFGVPGACIEARLKR